MTYTDDFAAKVRDLEVQRQADLAAALQALYNALPAFRDYDAAVRAAEARAQQAQKQADQEWNTANDAAKGTPP